MVHHRIEAADITKDEVEQAMNNYRSESAINKDGTFTSDRLIAVTEDELKNPDSLLKAHGFDIKEWKLVSARNNIWNTYSKKDGIQELYSSKITVKPRTDISLEEVKEFYEGLVKTYSSPTVKKYKAKEGYLLEIPIIILSRNLLHKLYILLLRIFNQA